ncbi:MAG TPA: hypothetical protein VK255_03540 [Patescibacteria group bacterium]|nr:hypothetical protein [Patescibacteria group bacterium]
MQKKLILFIIALFFLSSAYLLAIGNKFNDLNFGKNWWAVYFSIPKDNSLDFVVENHSNNSNFHWAVLADKEKIKEGDVKVENGKIENIKPDLAKATSGKFTIEVSNGNEKKEIYKNID